MKIESLDDLFKLSENMNKQNNSVKQRYIWERLVSFVQVYLDKKYDNLDILSFKTEDGKIIPVKNLLKLYETLQMLSYFRENYKDKILYTKRNNFFEE